MEPVPLLRSAGRTESLLCGSSSHPSLVLTTRSHAAYVRNAHASSESAAYRSQSTCWPTRWGQLPSAIRSLRQNGLSPLPTRRTWTWSVLVRLLLGLPSAHQELLRRQIPASRR